MAQPLTKLKKTNEVYTRPPSVETNIDGALAQDCATVHRRLKVTDRGSPEYLSSECLVYLVRHFTRLNEAETRDAVVWVLLERCAAILNARIDSRIPNAELLREDVLGEFALILANDGLGECPHELDYYECKFNRAFACLRIDMVRREQRLGKQFTQLPRESADSDEEVPRGIEEAISCPATQSDGLRYEEQLNALPDEIRDAVVLCHQMGYDVESNDPEKVTAATICKVSGRTIRKRLAQAKAILSRFNQEEL